ncbi:MAG TPA: hypothetical protein DDW68_00615 [Verrucomicrobiales bacterium]|nr:hypothetical protein [Verrucomicrobiales bacterium]HBE95656.1 hypothetical protein [Verrucomicrobiales bacterium]
MKLSLLVGLMTGSLWAGGLRVLSVSPPELKEAWQECAREHIEKHRYHTIILDSDSSPKGGLIPDRDTFHQNQWGKGVDIPTDVYFISPTSSMSLGSRRLITKGSAKSIFSKIPVSQ